LLRKAQYATVSLPNVPRTESSEKHVKNTTTKDYTLNSKTSGRNDEDAPSSEECDSGKGISLTLSQDSYIDTLSNIITVCI
jgi:hypothetical protein